MLVKNDQQNVLIEARLKLMDFTLKYCSSLPPEMSSLIFKFTSPTHPSFCKFLLDCSTLPEVVSLVQSLGKDSINPFFDVTRMWVYVLHRERLKRLHRWKSQQLLFNIKTKTTAAQTPFSYFYAVNKFDRVGHEALAFPFSLNNVKCCQILKTYYCVAI